MLHDRTKNKHDGRKLLIVLIYICFSHNLLSHYQTLLFSCLLKVLFLLLSYQCIFDIGLVLLPSFNGGWGNHIN